MFTYNNSLNIVDSVFTILDRIERVDYIKLGDDAITIVATLAAAIVAVTSYVVTALQLFWMEHGEHILTVAFQTVVYTADFANDVYTSGTALRRFVGSLSDRYLDRLFYTASGLI